MLIYIIYNKQATKHFYHLKEHIENQHVSTIVNI